MRGLRKLLVNRADVDDDEPGDFVVPASHRAGSVLMTVLAGSPALSAMIRDRLATLFDPRWEKMSEMMVELRPTILTSELEIDRRRAIFRDLATDEALQVMGDRGPDGLRLWLLEKYPELQHA